MVGLGELKEAVENGAENEREDTGDGRGFWKEESPDESAHDSGPNVALELLDKLEDATKAGIGKVGRDNGSDGDDDDSEEAAEFDELLLGGLGIYHAAVDVHGGDGGGRVEKRGEGGGDRSGDGGVDESADAWRDELLNEGGEGGVGIGQGVAVDLVSHEAGHDDGEGDEEPESTGEDHAELAIAEGFGGEVSLHDELVQTAVVDHDDPHTGEEPGPRELGVVCGEEHVEAIGICSGEGIPAPDGFETEEEDEESACDEREALDEVGPSDGFETTEGGVDHSDDADEDDALPELGADDGLHGDAAGIEDGGEHHYGVNDDGEDGHDAASGAIVAVFKKFGHGVDAGSQEAREKSHGDEDDEDRAHKLPGTDGESDATGCCSGHADHLLGGYVCGDD